MGPMDYNALALLMQQSMVQNVADDPMSRRDAVNPQMGLEGAGGPRQGGSRGMELIETAGPKGISAHVSGGRQNVTIETRPSKTYQDYGTNPKTYYKTDSKGGTYGVTPKAKGPSSYTVPETYVVRHSGGSSTFTDYNKAISAAMHHAGRKPK